MEGRYKLYFCEIVYDVTISEGLMKDDDTGAEILGRTRNPLRTIRVTSAIDDYGVLDPGYVQDTLLHEILHAVCSAVGFHPENEEEMTTAMAAGLLMFLKDPRNKPLIDLLMQHPSKET